MTDKPLRDEIAIAMLQAEIASGNLRTRLIEPRDIVACFFVADMFIKIKKGHQGD